MDSVGVRQLKQNASAVLRRVGAGETLQITDRGRPVALLVPIPQEAGVLDRLVAAGRATAPNGNLDDLPAPVRPTPGRPLPSEILEEMRANER